MTRIKDKTLSAAAIVLLLAAGARAADEMRIVGYFGVDSRAMGRSTHVVPQFGSFDAAGDINPIDLTGLAAAAHARGTKVLLSFEGDASAFQAVADDPAARSNFVSNALQAALANNAGGIEPDRESQRPLVFRR